MDGVQKLVQYVLIAVLGSTAATAALSGSPTDPVVLIGLLVTALGAFATFWTKNTPEQPWAKQAVGIFTAAVLVVVAAWTDQQFTAAEVVQVILAGLGAWQVGTVKNRDSVTLAA